MDKLGVKKTIVFIASMDTKGEEIGYAAKLAGDYGCTALILDTSTKYFYSEMGKEAGEETEKEVRKETRKESGKEVEKEARKIAPLQILNNSQVTAAEFEAMDKGLRIEAMAKAVAAYVNKLYGECPFHGVMSIGGGQNAIMSAMAMQGLPYGLPKLIVSPMASGHRTFAPYTGGKDIMVMHSVADIAGFNPVTKVVINNAVAAMVGLVNNGILLVKPGERRQIAATMLGITTAGAMAVVKGLAADGYETTVFHANGVGGACMEELLQQGYFDLVLDMNLHEITCEFFGGLCTGAYRRLEMAARLGIPQIVVPGAVDVLDFGITPENRERVLGQVGQRQHYFHNTGILHCKVTEGEARRLAQIIGNRLNGAVGPLQVIVPLGGFCEAGAVGGALYQPAIDRGFITQLKATLKPHIKLVEVDGNINSRGFSEVVLTAAKSLLKSRMEVCK